MRCCCCFTGHFLILQSALIIQTVTKPDIPIEESEEVQKDSSPSSEQEQEISSSAEGGEEWDCKIVLNVRELSQPKPRKCNTDSCDLAACCGWISNMDPNEIWFTCLDCQAKDYEGFPEVHELPLKYMTEEHRKLILEKCTNDPQVNLSKLPVVLLEIH